MYEHDGDIIKVQHGIRLQTSHVRNTKSGMSKLFSSAIEFISLSHIEQRGLKAIIDTINYGTDFVK